MLGFSLFLKSSALASDGYVILFWGDGCPHCDVVKEEIKENEYDKEITIDYKEIYNDESNAELFDQKVGECGISPYSAGVPMVYANGSCWIGRDEAIYAIEMEVDGVIEEPKANPDEISGDDKLEQDTNELEDDNDFTPYDEDVVKTSEISETSETSSKNDSLGIYIIGGIVVCLGIVLIMALLYNLLFKKS